MMGGPSSRLKAIKPRYSVDDGSGGFTVIEVIITLVVTMALLASVMVLVNGKQRVTAFNQAIKNVETEIRQAMSEVSSGYYPNNGSLTCTESAGLVTLTTAGSDTQGRNKPCVFMGKALHFAGAGTDPEEYYVYTIAGLNKTSLDFATSKPRLVARGTDAADVTVPDDQYLTKILLYGLTVESMVWHDGVNPHNVAAMAFMPRTATLSESDGSEAVNIVALNGSTMGQPRVSGVQSINNNLPALTSTYINPAGGIRICFKSGGTRQSGLLTIGGAGRQANVKVQIYGNETCA
jgi:type II secretory pathway pseudopilin PulG